MPNSNKVNRAICSLIPSLFFSLTAFASLSLPASAGYWLIIGSYRQGPGGKPVVSGITSPSLYGIPMDTLRECKVAGHQIFDEIYKPVWQFDNRWTCVKGGDK